MKFHDQEIETIQRQDRIDTILIDGFTINKNNSLKINVCENIAHHLGITLHPCEIKLVSRFGSVGSDGLPKSLRVKFHNPDIKNMLMSLKGSLFGSEVFLKEHLTGRQLDILTQAKIVERNQVLFKAWPKNDLIYGMDFENDKPKLIHDLDGLLSVNRAYEHVQQKKEGKKAGGDEAMDTLGSQENPGLDEINHAASASVDPLSSTYEEDFPKLPVFDNGFLKAQKPRDDFMRYPSAAPKRRSLNSRGSTRGSSTDSRVSSDQGNFRGDQPWRRAYGHGRGHGRGRGRRG